MKYLNGQVLTEDDHFYDHVTHGVPIQVYYHKTHQDIGFIEDFGQQFVRINHTFFQRKYFTFISRPGY